LDVHDLIWQDWYGPLVRGKKEASKKGLVLILKKNHGFLRMGIFHRSMSTSASALMTNGLGGHAWYQGACLSTNRSWDQ
jgi:hypothetical protein